MVRYYRAVVTPPFKGFAATIIGMGWARGAIFYGSEHGKNVLLQMGVYKPFAQTLPPLVIGIIVQFINTPLIRATVTIQNPKSELRNTVEAVSYIYRTRGLGGLWHGVSAGILKTVPKYMTAVVVKDIMEDRLPRVDPHDKRGQMGRSAVKSVSAGIAGAVLTNPLDVLRNEYVGRGCLRYRDVLVVGVWGCLLLVLCSVLRCSALPTLLCAALLCSATVCLIGCPPLIASVLSSLNYRSPSFRRMFKTDLPLVQTYQKLMREEGASFMIRYAQQLQ
jgi:hypothetical protein